MEAQQHRIPANIKTECTKATPMLLKRLPMMGYSVVLVGPSNITETLARAMMQACATSDALLRTSTSTTVASASSSSSSSLPLAIASLEASLKKKKSSIHRHHVHLVEHLKDLNDSCNTAVDHIVLLVDRIDVLQENLSCISMMDILMQRVTLVQSLQMAVAGPSSESRALRRRLQKVNCPIMFTINIHDPASCAVVAKILWKRTKIGIRAFHKTMPRAAAATTTTTASPLLFAKQLHK